MTFKLIKIIQIVKTINHVSIHLTCINVINLNLTNFSNEKNALNNLTHSTAILVMRTMREIDESNVGTRYSWLRVSWSRFLRRVHYDDRQVNKQQQVILLETNDLVSWIPNENKVLLVLAARLDLEQIWLDLKSAEMSYLQYITGRLVAKIQ